MLCVDTFIQTVARETGIPVPLLNNSNLIKSLRLRLRAVYQLAKYLKDKVHTGTCGVCSLPLCDIPPHQAEVVYMLCHCAHKVLERPHDLFHKQHRSATTTMRDL